MSKFSNEELAQRAFLRAAFVMYQMWEEKGSSDTKLILPPLIPDELVIVGESIGGGREHREHVIPRKLICDRCHDMFKVGESINDVAIFIRKHLKIVYISKQEQQHLDSGKELNLRQRMPDGWQLRVVMYMLISIRQK